jgi:hypothetical protein
MNTNPYPARHMPPLSVNLEEVTTRLRDLTSAELCDCCELTVTHAIFDIARLISQIHELYAGLSAERLRSANLEAAIRAALGAESDAETDPFAYLRDELPDMAGGHAYGA